MESRNERDRKKRRPEDPLTDPNGLLNPASPLHQTVFDTGTGTGHGSHGSGTVDHGLSHANDHCHDVSGNDTSGCPTD